MEIKMLKPKQNNKMYDILTYVKDIISQKFKEELKFTGQIEFIIHCKDGGVGDIEAHTKNKIKNNK